MQKSKIKDWKYKKRSKNNKKMDLICGKDDGIRGTRKPEAP